MANRNETLVKNTLLFAIGNFGSKLLQVILVPFYTRYMAEAEFGTTDLLQAVVSLLLPVCSMAIYEAVFRFAMEKENDKTSILSAGFVINLAGMAVLCLCGGVLSAVMPIEYMWLVILNTVANSFRTLYSQYARAINRVQLFTIDNVLMTLLVLVLNIFFIAVLNLGITGYMMGYILANLLSCLFLMVKLGGDRKIRFSAIRRTTVKDMLRFSVPLVPNAVCWWLGSFTDRVMIVAMISSAANGLYAAAHKIPSLLSTVVSIFFQAWQISANEEFKKKDIAQFYSSIFEQISACIFLLASLLIGFSQLINSVFLGASYASAWQYMPPLILSMTFFSFAQFLGSIYSANKKTTMAMVTNMTAVVINIILNYILIQRMGTIGAAVATATAYLVLWLVRVYDTGKIVPIRYQKGALIASSVIVTLQAIVVCLDLGPVCTYGITLAGAAVIAVLYRKTYISLAAFAGSMVKKLLGRS